MRIGELARKVGLRASAIRYYEDEGLIAAPPRVAGRRDYDAKAVIDLRLVRACQDAGFTIAETRAMAREVRRGGRTLSEVWRPMAKRKLDELGAAATRLASMQRTLRDSLRCECAGVESCALFV
jgi:MerR family redox-sensitive transcriptional activator SoxR